MQPKRAGLASAQGKVSLGFSTVYRNTADIGGGLAVAAGEVIVGNTTFSANTATLRGGGIANQNADLRVVFTTFHENTAPQGAGLVSFGENG